jgi:hypothetical protein
MAGDDMSKTEKLRQTWSKVLLYIQYRVPTGLRTVVGLVLVAGGGLGFLPVLGFWMVPLGLAVIALDAKILLRWFRGTSRPPDVDERQAGEAEDEK